MTSSLPADTNVWQIWTRSTDLLHELSVFNVLHGKAIFDILVSGLNQSGNTSTADVMPHSPPEFLASRRVDECWQMGALSFKHCPLEGGAKHTLVKGEMMGLGGFISIQVGLFSFGETCRGNLEEEGGCGGAHLGRHRRSDTWRARSFEVPRRLGNHTRRPSHPSGFIQASNQGFCGRGRLGLPWDDIKFKWWYRKIGGQITWVFHRQHYYTMAHGRAIPSCSNVSQSWTTFT